MAWNRPTSMKKLSDNFADHKKRGSVNPGVDYPVKVGTKVRAVADGKVNDVVTNIAGAGGRVIMMQHGSYKADYLHLSKILVKPGETVTAGQLIGLSGSSGLGKENGYGAHLHFSIRKGGKHLQGKGNLDFEAFMAKENAKQAAAAVEVTPAR